MLRAIEEMGFTEPMMVQAKTLPPIMERHVLDIQVTLSVSHGVLAVPTNVSGGVDASQV